MARPYNPTTDREAVHRVFREVGWSETKLDEYIAASHALAGEVAGQAECLVLTHDGTVRYLNEDIPMAAITGVTTSSVAKRAHLATQLTAQSVADAATGGALVSALTMFDQGFYDRLGFGAGGPEIWTTFDPADLRVDVPFEPPERLSVDDLAAIHACRLVRARSHGALCLESPEHTRRMAIGQKGSLTFGFRTNGQLTHCLGLAGDKTDHGPVWVQFIAYQTGRQFMQIMSFIHSLSDQFYAISMTNPPRYSLQDLLRHPVRTRVARRGSPFATQTRAPAIWQMRINDLPGCLAWTHLPGGTVRFNLKLTDPITDYLPSSAWRGVGGDYVVELGAQSGARAGIDDALPTMAATVNAFTRLWLGVRPATGLATTDNLSAPIELLDVLDAALRLPQPHTDWLF